MIWLSNIIFIDNFNYILHKNLYSFIKNTLSLNDDNSQYTCCYDLIFFRNLGSELAKVKNLNIATDGSKGVGDIVGRNFCEEQEIMNKGQSPKVFHIIPQVNSSVSYLFYFFSFIYNLTAPLFYSYSAYKMYTLFK